MEVEVETEDMSHTHTSQPLSSRPPPGYRPHVNRKHKPVSMATEEEEKKVKGRWW